MNNLLRSWSAAGAAAAAILTIPGCSASDGPASAVVLPSGLSSYDQITEILDTHDVTVQIDIADDGGEVASAGPVTTRVLRQADGDLRVETSFGDETVRFLVVDGTGYADQGSGWYEDQETAAELPATLSEIVELGYDFGAGAVAESADGYVVNGSGADGAVLTLTVDADRRLVAFRIEADASVADATVTYPSGAPLQAPGQLLAPGPDPAAMPAGEADAVARATLELAADTARTLTSSARLADVTAEEFSAALEAADSTIFVDIETAFDPWSVGFANDGRRIELVTSDGTGRCYRVSVYADGVDEALTGSDGAPNDLGFACGTSISHIGRGLYGN